MFFFPTIRPRSDTCKVCDTFKVQTTAEEDEAKRKQLLCEWDLHKPRAQNAYHRLKDTMYAKSNPDVVLLSFDLQQTLPTPHLSTNVVFYKRQMWTYNFGVHDGGSDQRTMYMWHEGTAARGSIEIGSCLLKHVSTISTSATRLVLYSDSCGGQNRNIHLLCLYLHIVGNPNLPFDVIDHKFMIPGHSYLPNDRDFGVIEQAKRRHPQIYVPQEWYELVRTACRSNPFRVIEMETDDFKAIKDLKKCVVNRKVDVTGGAIDWFSIRWIQVRKEDPLKFRFRRSLNELEAWKEVDIRRKSKGRPPDIGRFSLVAAQSGPRTLKESKINDILSMLDFVPPIHHSFYNQLLAGDVSSDSDSEDEE